MFLNAVHLYTADCRAQIFVPLLLEQNKEGVLIEMKVFVQEFFFFFFFFG